MVSISKEEALDYHRQGRPGKIEVRPTKPLITQRDLSLAYSPGVAEAVLAIDEDPVRVFELTARANLVGVVSNGTAILGLGDRGPLASKPVMEGKGVLFKRFADIDVFDIELDAKTPEEVIAAVKAIAPTFGGINLEDIKAPDSFEIEERLRAEVDIPVFHDDQHGTAIITGAAVINACEIIKKNIADLRIVFSGAGAAAIATAKFYASLGVKHENIIMADVHGVVYDGREIEMDKYKQEFATKTDIRSVEEALKDADMLIGLSVAGAVKPEWLKGMARDPIIFALANPAPEVTPEEARNVRPDAIIATGRSDYPNQVNNVLGFPFIFRGALDTYATTINEEMKLAAAHALAALTREDVPDSVLTAYNVSKLRFGRDYLIPKPFDPRVLLYVAPAVAQAAIDSGVARRDLDLELYREELLSRQGRWQQLRSDLINRARVTGRKRIVFAEGAEPKIVRAALQVQEERIGIPVLLGKPDIVRKTIEELGLQFDPMIIDPRRDERRERYGQKLYEIRQRKGMTRSLAHKLVADPNYFGPVMVKQGDADAFISGINYEYPEVIRPALQVVGTRPSVAHAAGLYIVIINKQIYLIADATVNVDPDAETLAEIAILAADFARDMGIRPRVAMLSYSNFGSSPHPLSNKMGTAVRIVREKRPNLAIDGEMQADTAVIEEIVEQRYPFSKVRNANVLIFPGLSSANIAYKLLGRLGGADTIGPVLLGMGGSVHVLQAGDDVEEIVSIAAVAALDAHGRH